MVKRTTSVTFTLTDASTVTVTDSGTGAYGQRAFDEFKRREPAYIPSETEGKSTYIPYHAILKAEITVTHSTVDNPKDEFCS